MTDNQDFCLKIVELEITLGFFRVRNLEKGMPKSLLGLMAKKEVMFEYRFIRHIGICS